MKINNALNIIESVDLEFDDDYEFMVNDVKSSIYMHKLYHDFYRKLDKLIEIGVYVKDIDLGLVDFFSKNEGKEIFLCWQFGEKKIGFWHWIDESYDDRKPVKILKEKKLVDFSE